MKKGKHVLSAVLALCIALGTAGCNTVKKGDRTFSSDPYKAETEVETEVETETETVVETETEVEAEPTTVETEETHLGNDYGGSRPTASSDEDYLAAVPEQDRYMFLSGTCKTTFPENSEIKRISFLKLNYDMTWKSVYGSVDLEIGTATYAYVSGSLSAPRDYQIFVLSGPEIEKCRNAFDSTLLHDEVQLGKGFWLVAVEYKDGTCYAYQFDKSGVMRNTPENIMINTYFDRMNLDDNTRYIFGLSGY